LTPRFLNEVKKIAGGFLRAQIPMPKPLSEDLGDKRSAESKQIFTGKIKSLTDHAWEAIQADCKLERTEKIWKSIFKN
jgi:hypothetical protein